MKIVLSRRPIRLILLAALAAAAPAAANINHVPYISTFYIEPRVAVSNDAVIHYYVTDYAQREYLLDDSSERFVVDYWVNGVRHAVSNVTPGDHALNLGPVAEGKVLFALQATDSQGRKSHRLFQEFLGVDPADEAIPTNQVLYPDLSQFNISSNDTNPVATTAGLTAMLKWAGTNGYRKVVLPKGRYRIDEDATVQMASGVTLDMNGSTFKLNPNNNGSCLMVEFVNCTNAHLVNGSLEGDLYEHDFTNAPNNSEWVNALSIAQGCEYSTVENVAISNFPGYGSCTTHRHTYNTAKGIGNNFAAWDVNDQGQLVASTNRVTNTNLIDVSSFIASYGFIQMGVYLGYQGNPAGAWVYRAHFYGPATNYLETIEGYMYRRLYPPANAKWARFTLLSTLKPTTLEIYNFRAPYNCAFKNIRHQNIRCVGMALSGMDNFLVESNRFDNCGWAAANCAFDAEDGWDLMHDLTFRNNVFATNPANEYLTCAGHNFMMISNTMKAYIYDRTRGYVFKDNTLEGATFMFGRNDRTGYVRVTNNTFLGTCNLSLQTTTPDRSFCVRDNTFTTNVSGPTNALYFYRSNIRNGAVNGRVVECDILNMTNSGGVFDLVDCTIANSLLKTSGYKVLAKVTGCTVSNSHCVTQGGTLCLTGNTLVNTDCDSNGDWSDGHEYILVSNSVTTVKPYLVYVGNSYKQMVMRDNVIASSHTSFVAVQLWNPTAATLTNQYVLFSNNVFNANGGYVLRVDRLPSTNATLRADFLYNQCNNIALYNTLITNRPNIIIRVLTNQLPTVTLSSPTNGASYAHDQPIAMAASASDPDGSIASVSFLADGAVLAVDDAPPYAFTWSNAPGGSHAIQACARDNRNGTNDSAVATIAVLTNLAPTIAITAPTNGSAYVLGSPIAITASASDPDGSVAEVVFYEDSNLLGTDTIPPFAFTWSNAPLGSHTLTARAVDDDGAPAAAAPVAITVSVPPSGSGTNVWSNLAGGRFDVGSNWSNGAPPGILDTARFTLTGASYTVSWIAPATNRAVTVQGGTVMWNLQGNTYAFTPSNNFSLVAGSPADLTISNGLFTSTDTAKDQTITLTSGGTAGVAVVRVTAAEVKTSRLFLGNATGDRVRLEVGGPGSAWREPFGGYCNWGVGANSRVTVLITNGACIRLGGNLNLGCSAGANAVIAVAGPGSSFTNGGFAMPYGNYSPSATALVSAADGGVVYCTGPSTLRSNGAIRLAGGQFLNSSTNLALDLNRGAAVEGSGLIRAKVRNMGGALLPGGAGAVGTLCITGDVFNGDPGTFTTNGTIGIELAGPASFDRLAMSNAFRAAGTLEVSLIDGYEPQGGATFKILDFQSISGAFEAVNLPPGNWDTNALYTTGEIGLVPDGYTTNTWSNPAGGAFETGSNWSNGISPRLLGAAVFNLTNGPYTVTWAKPVTNQWASVQKGTLTWDLQGNGYYFSASNNFSLLAGAPADLTISNGLFAITDFTKDRYLYLSGGGSAAESIVRVRNATVKSSRLFLGNAANDRVSLIVDGPGSRWEEVFSGYCNWGVGANGRTTVLVTNGACIRLGGNVNLGCSAGHQVGITVAGAGSVFTNGGFSMPYGTYSPSATATVTAADGGIVVCTGASTVRSNGTIRLLADGQFLNSTTNLALDLLRGAVLEGSGTVRAKVRNMGGTLRPGGELGIGVLSVTGEVYNADPGSFTTNGVIDIELAGTASFDKLVMANLFRASGILKVRFIEGFTPSDNDAFDILDFGSLSGSFATLDLPEGDWDTSALHTTGVLVYHPSSKSGGAEITAPAAHRPLKTADARRVRRAPAAGAFRTGGTGGLYRITYEAAVAAGLPPAGLAAESLALTLDGEPVPVALLAEGPFLKSGDSILFYAPRSAAGGSVRLAATGEARRMRLAEAAPAGDAAGDVRVKAAGPRQRVRVVVDEFLARCLLVGFTADPVWVLDVTDPADPVLLTGWAAVPMDDGTVGVYFSYFPTNGPASCLAVQDGAVIDLAP